MLWASEMALPRSGRRWSWPSEAGLPLGTLSIFVGISLGFWEFGAHNLMPLSVARVGKDPKTPSLPGALRKDLFCQEKARVHLDGMEWRCTRALSVPAQEGALCNRSHGKLPLQQR